MENKNNRKKYKQASRGGDKNSRMSSNHPKDDLKFQPLEVKVYGNNFDKALKAFRALVQKERTLSLYKEKQSYEKPSDKKRRKRKIMSRKREELNYPKVTRKVSPHKENTPPNK